jgi:hypothetical protein
MRLCPRQRQLLRDTLRRHFGAAARVWLCDSRLDDQVRGGDVDLLVECVDADPARLVDAKLAFLADLHATPAFEGERIDVVLYSPTLHRTLLPVQREALTRGVELTG